MPSLIHSRLLCSLAVLALVGCSSSSQTPSGSGAAGASGVAGTGGSAGSAGAAGGAGSAASAGAGGAGAGGAGASGAGAGGAGAGGAGAGGAGAGGAGSGGAGAGGAGAGGSAGASGAGAGGASGSGGAPLTLTLSKPATCSGTYQMDFGSTHVAVDVNGGRVSALSVGGAAVLASSAVTGTTLNWGSTFWPSPQSTWNWPPIAAIDSDAYTCTTSDAGSFTLTSAASTTPLKVQVSKKFYADLVKEAVLIDYTIKNTDTMPLNVAPWEISRIPPGSLSFYPGTAPGTRSGSTFAVPTTTMSAGGIYWYQQDSSATQYKLFDDGKGGWLATVTGTSVFVKQFVDVPAAQQFSTEAEIEMYSSGITAGKGYVELEQQGPMQTLAAGASLTWTVRWYVRKIPANVTAAAGSASLVSYVQGLLQ